MNIDIVKKSFLKEEIGRKWIISKALEAAPPTDNWQRNHTPYYLCETMIDMPDSIKDKKILVLFNIEFIEILIKKKKVFPSKIYFAADCNIEKEIAKRIYKIEHTTLVKDLDDIKKFYGTGG